MAISKSNKTILENRYNLKNKLQQQINNVEEEVEELPSSKNKNILDVTSSTGKDLLGTLTRGIIKGNEGIVDFLLSGVGLVGGLFDKGFQDKLSEAVKYDWTTEQYDKTMLRYICFDTPSTIANFIDLARGEDYQKQTEASLLKTTKPGEYVGGAVESIGELLPSVAIGNVAGALGAGTKVAQGISLGTFGASAAGSTTEQALNEGVEFNKAVGYGVATGITEAGIELASGGLGGLGKGFIDKAAGKVIKSNVIRLAIGEGLEEVASEYTQPLLQMIYKDRYEAPNLQQVADSFIVGALAGGIIQGGVKINEFSTYGIDGVKANNLINELNELNIQEEQEKIKGTLTKEKIKSYKEKRAKYGEELDTLFRAMDEKGKVKKAESYKKNARKYLENNVEKRLIKKDTYKNDIQKLENKIQKEKNVEIKNKLKTEKKILENKASAYIKSIPVKERAKVIKDLGLEWKYNEKGILRKTNVSDKVYNPITMPTRTKSNELIKKPIKNSVELTNKDIKTINISKKILNKFNKETNSNLDVVVYEGREDEASFVEKNVAYINKNNATNLKNILEGKEVAKELSNYIKEKKKVQKEIVKEKAIKQKSTVENEEKKKQTKTISDNVNLSKTDLIISKTGKKMKTIYDIPAKPLTSKAEGLAISLVDAQAGIINYGVKNGVKKFGMEVVTNDARATSSRVSFAFTDGIVDKNNKVITKGLDKIFGWINEVYNPSTHKNENAYYKRLAYTRAAHNHNIDRQNVYPFVDKAFLSDIKKQIKNTKDLDLLENGKGYYNKQEIDNLYKENKISKESYDIVNLKLEENKKTKSVFGTFLYYKDMNAELKKEVKAIFPTIYEAISNDKLLSSDSIVEQIEEIVLNRDLTTEETEVIKKISNLEKEISPAESKKAIKEIDKIDSRFAETNKDIVEYSRGLAQYQLDNKLISQETYDKITYTYPNYIPTNRDVSGAFGTSGTQGNASRSIVAKTIKRAKGSDRLIEPLDIMLAKKTMKIYRASDINNLAETVFDIASSKDVKTNDVIIEEELLQRDIKDDIDYDTHLVEAPRATNTITFYNGDKVYTMKVTENIYKGFYALNNHNIQIGKEILDVIQKGNSAIKKLVTDYNPFFIFRNAARDLQDAGIYSKFGITKLIKNLPGVIKDMKTNSEEWKLYRSVGGTYASMSDYEADLRKKATMSKTKNIWNKTLGRPLIKISTVIQKANFYVEQWIRFSEFKLAIDAGYSPKEALYLANDVTVNFGRSGTLVKEANRTVALFLNAQVQGFSKAKRTFVSKKSVAQWSVLLSKVAVLGLVPAILNSLMYDDDDDYKALSQYYKDNFYLFKVGSEFIKIPKGRILGIFGSLATRTSQAQQGEENAFKGYAENAIGNLSPVNTASGFRTIFSPFTDVRTNTTWYGGEIESSKYQGIKEGNRFTENTSWLSKKIGKTLNYSPLKIDYLLDQYSGVIGDVLIPATSSSTETSALTFVKNNIVVNSTSKNRYSTEFYDYYTSVNYANNDGDIASKYILKYMNKVKSSVSELYKQDTTIKEDTNLSTKDKNAQLKLNQIIINNTMKVGLSNAKILNKTLAKMTLDEFSNDQDYVEATKLAFGSEKALALYDNKVYNKSVTLNKLGINFDTYFNLYFDIKDYKAIYNYSTEDKSVQDSVSKKTQKYINKIKTNKNMKLLLYLSLGNNINNEQLQQVKNYLKKYSLTEDELKSISSRLA